MGFNWKVGASEKAFHSTYAGAYHIPDEVLDVVIARLRNLQGDILRADEAIDRRDEIRSLISAWNG